MDENRKCRKARETKTQDSANLSQDSEFKYIIDKGKIILVKP